MGIVLVVIPVVDDFQLIPKKYVRILAGKPLIRYAIESALACSVVDVVAVVTADEDVVAIADQFNCVVVDYPPTLAAREHLAAAIYHAIKHIENHGFEIDIVVTHHPAYPLMESEMIERMINILQSSSPCDTVVAVVPQPNQYWRQDGEDWFPLFGPLDSRKQQLIFREMQGLWAARREIISSIGHIGNAVQGFALDECRALALETWTDWHLAEKILAPRYKIVFIANGDATIGTGHIYRGIAMSDVFAEHSDFIFISSVDAKLGIQLLNRRGVDVLLYADDRELVEIIANQQPDIVINDILDTTADYITELKALKLYVVNFEDLGDGSLLADLVINSLYDDLYLKPNHYVGPEYECLRQEFLEAPVKEIGPNIKNILITFGGIDAANSSVQVLLALEDHLTDDMSISLILGLGYPYLDQLEELLAVYSGNVQVYRNVIKMSEYILEADLVFTSAGRTVLEVMAIGTPCIVMVQNARETRHTHANSRYGIMNLGPGEEVTLQKISQAFRIVAEDFPLRQEMSRRMLRVPVRDGDNRVKNLILNNYNSFRIKNGDLAVNGLNQSGGTTCSQ